jgi:hypothetical protein
MPQKIYKIANQMYAQLIGAYGQINNFIDYLY